MKMTRMIASASSPRYSSIGLRNSVSRDIQAARCGSMTTAVGGGMAGVASSSGWPPAAPSADFCGGPPRSSLLMSVIISWRWPVPPVISRIVRTLSLTVWRYLGNSWSRLPICSVTSQLMPPSTIAVNSTVTITDGVLGIPS